MRVRAALAAAVLLPLGAAVPAVAAPAPAPDRGILLTVSGSGNTWIRGLVLHCPPGPEDHHPDAAGACAALEEAGGDFDALAGDPRPCTHEYDPVTVTARGEAADWKRTFPSACAMDAATGPVFRF
ncbi:SSI family serine proteinase inhibitor [Streptomyces sp. NPDC059814]|uniref:SSI family serine proteinase inhibitor n=1 Tax=Streptomyces sp. NPDC059814 TaxID=3346959 RepID=UPI00365D5FA3